MGVEHPTRTDTKVETGDQPKASDQAPSLPQDQPGAPGQKSRLESRAAAQQPYEPGTDQKRETPPPARSIRAENSNDPNDDPNRIGTPRADSLAIARGEKLETDENEADAAETEPSDTSKARPDEAEPPADDNREPDNADPAAPGEQDTEASEQVTPSHPKPQENRPPAPETYRTDESADVTPEPGDGTGPTPPQDAQPLDHGILDDRAEDVERPAETNPSEVADGKPPAEIGEQLEEAPPVPEPEPDAEAPPAPTDGEQDHGKKAEGEAVAPVPEKAKEPLAHSFTDKDLDPIAAGAPDSRSKDDGKGRDGDQERIRSQDDPLEKYRRAVRNPQRVFRGDTRSPDDIFINGDGFRARGTSNDLKRYAELNEPSRFIGTSMTEDAAKPFTVAVQGSKRKLHGWVYEVESPAPAINVNKALGLKYRLVLWGQSEKEMAYLDHIPREHIRRAREVKGLSYTGKVVENPHFQGR
ncbi:scabin-related ADP-ribosyltransferase [Actinomadura mexicana]|uniref:Pierisin-like domain-containing protein n=1 Tax=Actinomadura mexicana TaxID=134959 RepID=A0A239CZ75_9ACTN|nr:hypothetical protein [Actinomadura mexicana]SNS25152.1 hypothetical protein SAMN06265355_113187 [Actinomadura mexicana]